MQLNQKEMKVCVKASRPEQRKGACGKAWAIEDQKEECVEGLERRK